MDAKITKKRLGHMLSYDWIKIIALVVAVIVVWWLIFSVAATKITSAQQFTVYNFKGTYTGGEYSSLIRNVQKNDVFSYDVIEVDTYDLTTTGSELDTVLSARLQTGEGDAMFISNDFDALDEDKEYQKPDGTTYHPTYLQEFLTSYYYSASELGDSETGYLKKAEAYLAPFFGGDVVNGVLDEEAAEKEFSTRIKKLNDKRFKTKKEKSKGLEEEKERLEKLRKSYLDFLSYLDEGYISLEEVTFYTYDYDGNAVEKTGKYAVNLSKGKENERLLDVAYHYSATVDEDGISHNVKSTKDTCLLFLDVVGEKYKYSIYETMSFVCYLVENYIK